MASIFLFDTPILPSGFKFPESYLDMMKSNNIPELEPWNFLCKDIEVTLIYYGMFLIKYQNHPLIHFAIANNETGFFNDGYVVLACFEGMDKSRDPKVYYYDSGNSMLVDWMKKII